jgi:hypothetical protein
VNPVIAVLLGWLILSEPVTARTFLAMALTVGAVVWIQFSHKLPLARSDRAAPRPPVPAPSAGATPAATVRPPVPQSTSGGARDASVAP